MMRCIFCGKDSSSSKSVEHIIPESFGNSIAILRKGIVCDNCNNYFARKVEQPFLEVDVVRMLRQELEIENKRGKLIKDYAYPRVGAEYVRQIYKNIFLIYTKVNKTEEDLAADVAEYNNYLFNSDKKMLEENIYISRLLAKMTIEYFVYRCGSTNEVCEYIISDKVFQPIRRYARYGDKKIWPYNSRRIYARNEAYKGDIFSAINWEADFLFLGNGEIYFVIAMYGIEYVINLGGPYLDGYSAWLSENAGKSPLYLSNEEKAKLFDAYIKTTATTDK